MKKVFISTPIYYSSGKPHIGHAYTTVLADVIKGYYKLFNHDVLFVTGLDEHGQKIQEKAESLNLNPKQYVDSIKDEFLNLWKLLNIEYDKFIRTTDEYHIQNVQKVFSEFYNKQKIYLDNWKGFYCSGCEENKTKKELVEKDNQLFCDIGHSVQEKNEESYFFKMKEDVNWLLNEFFNNVKILPENRKKELINSFLKDLEDLSITRTKTSWGIKTNENPNHTIYVWLDALFSYLSALGYNTENDIDFNQYWNNESIKIHLMSKEIIRFHCIYWPIFLKNLELPTPDVIISHGWIITKEGKMSKSLGNVIDPYYLINEYGSDALRWFMIKEFNVFNDNVFCEKNLIETYNADLANNVGNLTSRLIGMITKYFDKRCPSFKIENNEFYNQVKLLLENTLNKVKEYFSQFKLDLILKEIINIVNYANKLIEDNKPWELKSNNEIDKLSDLLNVLLNINYFVIYMISPVIKNSLNQFIEQLNISSLEFNENNLLNFNKFDDITLNESTPIFKRIEAKKA